MNAQGEAKVVVKHVLVLHFEQAAQTDGVNAFDGFIEEGVDAASEVGLNVAEMVGHLCSGREQQCHKGKGKDYFLHGDYNLRVLAETPSTVTR